jgi:protein gp37
MSDLMGAWNTDNQIRSVLGWVRAAHWHTFQLLTKNAPRLLKFKDEFPPNLWVGCSMPPSIMKGRELTADQQARMFDGMAHVLDRLDSVPVRWISFEPLSWDVARRAMPGLEWAVIGAASRGKQYYQPKPEWVENLLETLSLMDCPVFFKGNLDWSPMRREFPAVLLERLKSERTGEDG